MLIYFVFVDYVRCVRRIMVGVALTRNPRVDFISKRVEEIKTKKADVASLAASAKNQMKSARKTMGDLDRAMLDAYKAELGERKWDEEKGTYTRVLHPEEKRLIADMERVLARCMETMDRVLDSYLEHLEDTANKPLTFNTPDEDSRLERVMQTKEEYKVIRTLYSDAMIDADADLATGGDMSAAKKERVEDTRQKYDQMSERLCDDALKYEQVYREELAQRVSAHFTAEQQLLRGVSTAMKDLYPYTRGLTLDWEELRTTRRANLAAAKRGTFDDADADINASVASSLPRPSDYSTRNRSDSDTNRSSSKPSSNPFGNLSSTASGAAAAVASASKMTSKNVSNIIAAYAPNKPKTGTKSDGGLDNIKL